MMYMYVVYFRLSPLYNAIDVAFGANLKFKPACLMTYMYTMIKVNFRTICVSHQDIGQASYGNKMSISYTQVGGGLFQVRRIKVNVPGWEG